MTSTAPTATTTPTTPTTPATPAGGSTPPSSTPSKPRPKAMPKEAPGLENHPTANPNFRGCDPNPKAPAKGPPSK